MSRGHRWVLAFCVLPVAAAVLALPRYTPRQYGIGGVGLAARGGLDYQLEIGRLRAADSRVLASDLVAAHAHDTAQLVVTHLPDLPDALASRLRQGTERALAGLPRRNAGTKVLLDIVNDTGQVVSGLVLDKVAQLSNWFSTDAFVWDSLGAPDACTVVFRVHSPAFIALKLGVGFGRQPGFALGPCAWYAAYGTPGRGVSRWFDSTGHQAVRAKWPFGDFVRGTFFFDTKDPWGGVINSSRGLGVVLAACAAGRPGVCSRYLLTSRSPVTVEPGLDARDRITSGRGPYTYSGDGVLSLLMMRMERDLGPERFEQFWKSDLPVPAAFEAARGEPLESWVRRELIAMSAPYHAGPIPRTLALVASMFVSILMIGFGVYEVSKRSQF